MRLQLTQRSNVVKDAMNGSMHNVYHYGARYYILPRTTPKGLFCLSRGRRDKGVIIWCTHSENVRWKVPFKCSLSTVSSLSDKAGWNENVLTTNKKNHNSILGAKWQRLWFYYCKWQTLGTLKPKRHSHSFIYGGGGGTFWLFNNTHIAVLGDFHLPNSKRSLAKCTHLFDFISFHHLSWPESQCIVKWVLNVE